MEIEQIGKLTQKMVEVFVNEIGLDGDAYASTMNNCPIVFGKVKGGACGQYLSPADLKVNKSVSRNISCDNEERKLINEFGVILIDRKKTLEVSEKELLITMIHERFHANRNLLIYDAILRGSKEKKEKGDFAKNEYAYIYRNGKIDKATKKLRFSYADASQEILKGSIDTSIETAKQYKKMNSNEELQELEDDWGETLDRQKALQQYVDEALVELMSILSYKLCMKKTKGEDIDIWKELETVQKDCVEEGYPESAIASRLILRHKDFELFNWMIDPIGYSNGDIHCDFFAKYTENDKDLVEKKADEFSTGIMTYDCDER